ncbi:uncharacterized protein LOC134813988 [Bolinopsis microptera]|uniref:uncharacterized protein LOC134813988 n=1 Tax=Bolinopsis microptera TaxID=2820187 RepID=UPI00307AECF0
MMKLNLTRKQIIGLLIVGLLVIICAVVVGMAKFEKTSDPPRYHFKIQRNVQIVGGKTLIVNTVNGNIKGPAINVRRGERLSVLLTNELPDHGVSLHWHGFEMRGVQHYDGVVGLTQCAVAPGESFLYEFVVDEEPGTYWWHGHSNMVPVGHDFIRGPLIVQPASWSSAKDDSTSGSYVRGNEISLFYKDLFPNFPGYDHPLTMGGLVRSPLPDFEGYHSGAIGWTSGILNGEAEPIIDVQNGEILFRVINGGGIFSYFFSVDGYKLTVVGTDGGSVEPYETDVILISAGERYDVRINFNLTQPHQNVWIRAMTPSAEQKRGIMGVLRIRANESISYQEDSPETELVDMTKAKILNCDMFEMPQYDCNSVTNLISTIKRVRLPESETHIADFLFQFVPQYGHLWSIDHGIWKQSVLPHKAMIADSFNPVEDLHPNTDVLTLPLNKSVTIIIRSVTAFPHPIHLHGHKFEVLEVATRLRKDCPDGRCDLPNIDRVFTTNIEALSTRPRQGVLKDTVIVPVGGAIAIRFNTDNPGVWFLHCHLDQHMEDGQGFIVHEGGYTQSTFPPDYPSCDYEGKLQHHETADCNCYEDTSLDERWRMKSTMKCSKPHLCRHVLGT